MKLYAIDYVVPIGGSIGPMPWSRYPYGVQLVEINLGCDEKGARLRVVVECDPAIGEEMGWIPFSLKALDGDP
jgi:hypothetical protein